LGTYLQGSDIQTAVSTPLAAATVELQQKVIAAITTAAAAAAPGVPRSAAEMRAAALKAQNADEDETLATECQQLYGLHYAVITYEELHAKAQEDYDTASATREGQIMAKAANAAPTVASGTESDAPTNTIYAYTSGGD
jgi:hypothetical protein